MSRTKLSPNGFYDLHTPCSHLSRCRAMSVTMTRECDTWDRIVPLGSLRGCAALGQRVHLHGACRGHHTTPVTWPGVTVTSESCAMGRCLRVFAVLWVQAGASKANGEVAHASRGGHVHHSPSQDSDFDATKEGAASPCHQPGVAGAVHGEPGP